MPTVIAHKLDRPHPEKGRSMVAKLIGDAAKVAENDERVGSDFDDTRRLAGYDFALQKASAEIAQSLHTMRDFAVALFVRGNVDSKHRVKFKIHDTWVEAQGGASEYNTSLRWFDGVGVALALRDAEAQQKLCAYNPDNFEDVGPDTAYLVTFARGLAALIDNSDTARELLEQALAEGRKSAEASDWTRRIGVTAIELALALAQRNQEAFTAALVEALEGYAAVHRRKSAAERPEAVMPFLQLGLSALAKDRGLTIEVESDYLPRWLVDGTLA
jgi:hypothetical protein